MTASGRRLDVSVREVVALEEKRLAARHRQGIGGTVAKIELGGVMRALAEPAIALEGDNGLVRIEGLDDFDGQVTSSVPT